MIKNNVGGYINYFRQLAVQHKDIRHDPTSEDGDGEPEAKKFTRISPDEVIEGLRTTMGFPALTLELYESSSESAIVHDVNLKPRGAFMIVDKVEDKLFSSEQKCYEKTEQIIYELLQQMWQDHYGEGVNRCGTPFKEVELGKIQIVPVGPIFNGKFYGYRAEFDFEFQKTIDLAQPPAAGTFITE